MNTNLLFAMAAALSLAPPSLLGCRDNHPEEPEMEETVGDEAEDAAEETGEAAEEAGDEAEETVDETEHDVDRTL